MASLSQQIDRLSRNARAIKTIAAKIGSLDNDHHTTTRIAGPFTHAVLHRSLGDLIRDIDPSELGLFSLTTNRSTERDAHPEITRVQFPGATPLKQNTRKDDVPKAKELEPEVYAQAALKYLDRYEPIRPMPRAHARVTSIIEQIAAVRDSMKNLVIELDEITSSESQTSPKDRVVEEEACIHEFKSKILELQKRKETLLKQQSRSGTKFSRPNRGAIARKPELKVNSPHVSPPKQDAHEDEFWSTPGPTARHLHFDNLLTDELAELGDVSMSFSSPITIRTTTSPPAGPSHFITPSSPTARDIPPAHDYRSTGWEPTPQRLDEDDEDVDLDEDTEKTIVLNAKPVLPVPESPPSPRPVTPTKSPEANPTVQSETPSGPKRQKVRVNSEVERIVSRIWSTVGEIIMPGKSFNPSGPGGPPRAKETIAHLQTLAAQTPAPLSPSMSSETSLSVPPRGPTSQQILTAHLLLALLSSPPSFSLPLNKVKDGLSSKAGGTAAAVGVGSTRVLYGCVAKRLVKIERGGGEQIVKFDI